MDQNHGEGGGAQQRTPASKQAKGKGVGVTDSKKKKAKVTQITPHICEFGNDQTQQKR